MSIFPVYSFLAILLSINIAGYGASPESDLYPGYVVTTKGDTMSGFILLRDQVSNARKCVFKETLQAAEISYGPEELKAYTIPGRKYFYSSTIPGLSEERIFLECIVSGRLSLFFFKDRYFVKIADEMEELVISEQEVTKDGKAFRGKRYDYKEVLQKNMFDCPTSLKELETTTLNKKPLTQLFVNYLACVGSESTLYESTAVRTVVQFGFGLAATASNLSLSYGGGVRLVYIDAVEIKKEVSFSPSLVVEFSRPELSNKFKLRTGLTLYSLKHEIYHESSAANLTHELTIENTRLELPVFLKYYLLKNNVRVYMIGGAGFNTFIKWADHETLSTIMPGSTLRESSEILNYRQNFINFMAGMGVDLSLGKQTLRIEALLGKGPGVMEGSSSITGSVNTVSIGAIMLF